MRKLLASPRPRALGLLAVAACVLTACGGGGSEPDTDAAATTADSAITVTDDLGSVVTLDAPAERIACLTLICVDALKEVGITPVAYREDLALDPRYAGPDAEMRKITGSFGEENVEDIALSEPDLVIGLGGVQDGLRGAVEEVAPMYLVNPATWQDSVEFLRTVGELTARQAEANAAAEAFTAEVEAAAERRSEVTTLSMYGEPGSLGVDSVATPVGSLLAEVSNYPWQAGTDAFATVSVEQIAAVDPDVVFAQAFSSGSDSEPLSDRLASNPLWAGISAAQNDRVIEVDAGVWATGRGTVSLRMVLETVMAELDIDIAKHRPKTFDDLQDTSFDLVITLTPEAQHKAVEMTRTMAVDLEYWPTIDPTATRGSRDVIMAAYRQTRDSLVERIRQRFDGNGTA